ncbi:hypothetical protein [Micromonospora chalcea]|uniref:hypothetical protein n=1 Tax=Micromonospora chalcea TaxID=1874 RepID=UPI003D75249A
MSDDEKRAGAVTVAPGDPRYCWNPFRHEPHTFCYDLMDGRTGHYECSDRGDFAAGNIGWTAGLRGTRIPVERVRVLLDTSGERDRQVQRYGYSRYPDGTGRPGDAEEAARLKRICKANGPDEDNWRDIAAEEVSEAFAETDIVKLRGELVQVMAVLAAWVEDIDYRIQLGEHC